ncbi:hypothetical protein [uncultured Methanocorpusculum sp.]|nr:hypothetical protein [uncultured Methanocorpusculum sp.]
MTETQKPEKTDTQNAKQEETVKKDCEIKASYGLYIALIGLLISFLIAVIMIWFGMRTASDLVAVIAAFTGITGTLAGYFLGEKAGSTGKENTEKKLSASVDALISEKTNSAATAEKLLKSESNNKVLGMYLKTNQDTIKGVAQKLALTPTQMGFRGIAEDQTENVVNDVLYSLNEAKIPDEVLKSLHVYDN